LSNQKTKSKTNHNRFPDHDGASQADSQLSRHPSCRSRSRSHSHSCCRCPHSSSSLSLSLPNSIAVRVVPTPNGFYLCCFADLISLFGVFFIFVYFFVWHFVSLRPKISGASVTGSRLEPQPHHRTTLHHLTNANAIHNFIVLNSCLSFLLTRTTPAMTQLGADPAGCPLPLRC